MPDPWRPPAHAPALGSRPAAFFKEGDVSSAFQVWPVLRVIPPLGRRDRRVFGSCGPPNAHPRAVCESSSSPARLAPGGRGPFPRGVLRPPAVPPRGAHSPSALPSACAMRPGTARSSRHGAVPGRARLGTQGRRAQCLGPVPVPPVVRRGLPPRCAVPPEGSHPRGKAGFRVGSDKLHHHHRLLKKASKYRPTGLLVNCVAPTRSVFIIESMP